MIPTAQVPALAALGAATGASIGRHLDRSFRAMVSGEDRTEEPRFLRLVTGEPHPFGNFVILSAPVDLDATREGVDPLVARSVPAAVLFPDIDVPADVNAYLTGQRFVLHGALPAMGVDIDRLKPTALPA